MLLLRARRLHLVIFCRNGARTLCCIVCVTVVVVGEKLPVEVLVRASALWRRKVLHKLRRAGVVRPNYIFLFRVDCIRCSCPVLNLAGDLLVVGAVIGDVLVVRDMRVGTVNRSKLLARGGVRVGICWDILRVLASPSGTAGVGVARGGVGLRGGRALGRVRNRRTRVTCRVILVRSRRIRRARVVRLVLCRRSRRLRARICLV